MSEHVETNETPAVQETVLLEDEAADWAAVLAAAPYLGRLPDMVASRYQGTGLPEDDAELKELQECTRLRVRDGTILVFNVLEDNVAPLFEKFDVSLGSGIDLLMEDLCDAAENDESVENYSAAEMCGKLFAYVAMDSYCYLQDKEHETSTLPVDNRTGFLKNMEVMAVMPILESVIDCVRLAKEFRARVLHHGVITMHTTIFLMLDSNSRTVWH